MVLLIFATHTGTVAAFLRGLLVRRSGCCPAGLSHSRCTAHHAHRSEQYRQDGQDPHEAPCKHRQKIGSG